METPGSNICERQDVAELRVELRETQRTLHELITRLEQHFGKDIDGDGWVGG